MESMASKKKSRPRRSFTDEFKAEIEVCQRGDRSAERDAGTREDGGLTAAERDEFAALRRENLRLFLSPLPWPDDHAAAAARPNSRPEDPTRREPARRTC